MLEHYGLITSLAPSGGWVYPQEYQGGIHEVVGQDGKDLVKQLLQFRLHAKLPIGHPEREIAEYIKEKSPNNARFKGYKHKTLAEKRPVPNFVPLIERIRLSMAVLIEEKPRFVSEDEADVRADACAGCVHNVAWRIAHCPPCNAETDYLALVLRQRTSYRRDEELKACRLHDFHLQSGVLIDQEFLPPRSEQAPPHCWIPVSKSPISNVSPSGLGKTGGDQTL